jgi:DNA-binding NarL/FixJ family response regulator
MDINLANKSGIDLCALVKEKYASIHVIALSTINQQSYIEKMIENCTSGYVIKNASQQELMEVIQLSSIGKKIVDFEVAKTMHNSTINNTEKLFLGVEKKRYWF